MKHSKQSLLVAVIAACALLLCSVFAHLQAPPALAAGAVRLSASPTPSPAPLARANTADPIFSLQQADMISNYPEGAEYVLRVSSRAGAITDARVTAWTRSAAPRSAAMTWDAARGAFVYRYRFYQPPWVEFRYRFEVTDSAGNIYRTPELYREYGDAEQGWVRLETPGTVVLVRGGRAGLAGDLIGYVEAAMRRMEAAFGYALLCRPYVVVLPDATSFAAWQAHPDPYLTGQTIQALGYTVQSLEWGEDNLFYTTLPHEMAHIYQGRFQRAEADIPDWFTEGDATYFELLPQYDYAARVRALADRLPSLRDTISTAFPGPDGRNRWPYDLGFTFVQYWIDTFGIESHRRFWQAQQTMPFVEALEDATGVGFDTLERGWRESLGARGPLPTPSTPLSPLPRPFAGMDGARAAG